MIVILDRVHIYNHSVLFDSLSLYLSILHLLYSFFFKTATYTYYRHAIILITAHTAAAVLHT